MDDGRRINLNRKLKKNIWRSVVHVFIFYFLLFLNIFGAAVEAQMPEYQVKAELIVRVPNNEKITWPKNSWLQDTDKAFIIGVIDGNPFENYLNMLTYPSVNRKTLGKITKVKYIKNVEEIADCNLLFITDNIKKDKLQKILEFTSQKPILTFCDNDEFTQKGVICTFTYEPFKSNVIVEINEVAARKAGFKLSDIFYKESMFRNVNPWDEFKDKATTIFGILNFIEWPSSIRITESSVPFNVTFLDNNNLLSALQTQFKKEKFYGKKIKFRTISKVEDIGDTNLLYISASKKNELPQILNYLRNKPILVISEIENAGYLGVHINFFYDGIGYRLEINFNAAAENGIKIKQQLMQIPGSRQVFSKK